jgi:hypothetical protein
MKRHIPKINKISKGDTLKHAHFSLANIAIFAIIFAAIGGYLIYSSFAATTCNLNATTANLSSQFTASTPGQTICLTQSGNYGTFAAGAKAAPGVTITPASGVNATLTFNISNATNVTVDGTLGGGTMKTNCASNSFGGTNSNVYIKNVGFRFDTWASHSGSGILNFDNITVGGSDFCTASDPSIMFGFDGTAGGSITNSTFIGSTVGNSTIGLNNPDGIRADGAWTVGPGNVFTGFDDTVGANHTDPVQFCCGGSVSGNSAAPGTGGTTFRGNYFTSSTVVAYIAAWDSTHDNIIENNVFVPGGGASFSVSLLSDSNSILRHNTMGTLQLGHKTGDNAGNGTHIYDNILDHQFDADPGLVFDHNLALQAVPAGTGNLVGAPTFVGPLTSHDGYLLTSSSRGHLAASDGTDIGIYALGGTTPTPPPPPPPPPSDTTPPTVSLTAPTAGSTVSGASVTLSATAADNVAVSGVQFKVDGNNVGSEDTASPFSIAWDSRTATNGSHTITAVARDAAGNSTTSSSVSVTTNNATSCSTSSSSWANNSFASQNVSFTFDFDATPSATNIDSVTGLSSAAAGAFTDLAAAVRFNNTGTIDARNGGAYAADTALSYVAGTSYHFTLTVNVTNHTYTVVVTPAGGSATTVATNYAFRTEQASVASLANWATNSTTGTQTTCGVTVAAVAAGPKAGDINGDNSVNITDLSLLLSSYGQSTTQCVTNNAFKCDLSSPADNTVNIFDLSILLSNYGK